MPLKIILDNNPSYSYFAGQTVAGKLVVELTEERKLKHIQLISVGEAKVSWTKHHHRKRTWSTYRSNQPYFRNSIALLGQNSNPDLTLPAGTHEFPFEILLPLGIPSSFVGTHGYVRYYLEASVKKNWGYDEKTSCMYTVNGILDLNVHPKTTLPLDMCVTGQVSSWFSKPTPVEFKFHVDRSGFVPGEIIPFIVETKNSSKQKVPGATLKLKATTTYRTKSDKSTTSTRDIMQVKGPDAEPGNHKIWICDTFQIPSIPPTHLAGSCEIIDITYELKIKFPVPGGNDKERYFGITIGTKPFHRNLLQMIPQVFTPSASAPSSKEIEASAPSAPIDQPEASAIAPSAPALIDQQQLVSYNDLPPTYEEVMQDPNEPQRRESDDDLIGFSDFVPCYPMYSANTNNNQVESLDVASASGR